MAQPRAGAVSATTPNHLSLAVSCQMRGVGSHKVDRACAASHVPIQNQHGPLFLAHSRMSFPIRRLREPGKQVLQAHQWICCSALVPSLLHGSVFSCRMTWLSTPNFRERRGAKNVSVGTRSDAVCVCVCTVWQSRRSTVTGRPPSSQPSAFSDVMRGGLRAGGWRRLRMGAATGRGEREGIALPVFMRHGCFCPMPICCSNHCPHQRLRHAPPAGLHIGLQRTSSSSSRLPIVHHIIRVWNRATNPPPPPRQLPPRLKTTGSTLWILRAVCDLQRKGQCAVPVRMLRCGWASAARGRGKRPTICHGSSNRQA